MADLPSRIDIFGVGRDYVVQRARRIDPAQVDVEGSDINIAVGVSSVMAAQVINQLGYRAAALTLGGADGDDLDRLAFDRYGLARKGASPARGTVSIFRTTIAGGAGTVPIGTLISTTTGVQYTLTTSASFGGTDLTSSARVQAVQAGKASQVAAHQLARLSNPGALFDRTLLVDNALAMAGGEDAEQDDAFRSRIRDFWRTARRGILAAIEFGALTVPGVVSAQAIETTTLGGMPARVVNLYIADSTGVASQALADAVSVALQDYRAGGIAVLVSVSLPLIVEVSLRLAFRANVDTATLALTVRQAITEYVNAVPVNGTLSVLGLGAVLQRYEVDGLVLTGSAILSPTGNLVPEQGQTIRTTLAHVTVVP